MNGPPRRTTVELGAYPDLVVIYLGMRAHTFRGVGTLIGFGSKIRKAVAASPDGLLQHENVLYSMFPLHVGMRQYWRDFDALEKWARSGAHAEWWKAFLKDPKGTGFWHETYSRNGLVESVYIDMPPVGLASFASVVPARGSMFSARRRLGLQEEESASVVRENDLYGTKT